MEFLGIPFFDDDFYKMLFRFGLNLAFLSIIIKLLYFRKSPKRSYQFTYFLIGTIVFFISFTLKKYQIDLGMALGLFAIFGIIRYRTDTIPIREMTYLFVIIGISIMNALFNKKMSYAEILASNILIILTIYVLENIQRSAPNLKSKKITILEVDLAHESKKETLKEFLIEKTGLPIERVEINQVDFTKPAATISMYYDPTKID